MYTNFVEIRFLRSQPVKKIPVPYLPAVDRGVIIFPALQIPQPAPKVAVGTDVQYLATTLRSVISHAPREVVTRHVTLGSRNVNRNAVGGDVHFLATTMRSVIKNVHGVVATRYAITITSVTKYAPGEVATRHVLTPKSVIKNVPGDFAIRYVVTLLSVTNSAPGEVATRYVILRSKSVDRNVAEGHVQYLAITQSM